MLEEKELLESMNKQLNFLNDKFKVFESLNENNEDKEEDIATLKLKLEDKEHLYNKLKHEFEFKEKENKEKLKLQEMTIDNLRRELELMKSERNENIHQMQNAIKDKFAVFNSRRGHSHQSSITSMSSMSTNHDERLIEKMNTQKSLLEKQIIEEKFKYTEILARLNDLEGQLDKSRQINQENLTKLKSKDSIIKKLTEERDHFKYNTNPHYAYNSCSFQPPEINERPAETVEYINYKQSVKIMDEYLDQIEQNTSENLSEVKSQPRGSIIKYFKSLFK